LRPPNDRAARTRRRQALAREHAVEGSAWKGRKLELAMSVRTWIDLKHRARRPRIVDVVGDVDRQKAGSGE